ncbi:MAG TPA: hypothetical protein RMH99_10585 [Sandaracinaceae bacterium LLY-WYZ-13_1]|nr:hypothetical protein [Sandaracinaceae bacterium LLY-WYZ-13_1]
MDLAWDERDFPLVRIGPMHRRGTALAELRAGMTRLFERERPFVAVLVAPTLAFEPAEIQAHRRWLETAAPDYRAWCRGIAYVLEDAATRLRFRGITVGTIIPAPYEVFDRLEPAERWARAQLES